MRLIDADKIVNYRVTADDGKKYVLLPIEKLGDIPTAYDVDKVCKALSHQKTGSTRGYRGFNYAIEMCIGIVKRGGVDDM